MTNSPHPASYLARFEVSPPRTAPLGAAAWLTSAFHAEDEATFAAEAGAKRPTGFYSRYGNPTVRALEDAVARLEGAEAGLAAPSGLAALAAALLGVCPPGGRILTQSALYAGSRSAVARIAALIGAQVVAFDGADPGDLERALRPGADLVLLETPANPLLEVTDLAVCAEICKAHKAISLVDNTVATPLNQRPLSLGCDLVVHSATKTLSGHGDVTAGLVCGGRDHIEEIWSTAHILGMALDPFAAWLVIRGLRTLDLRVARQNATALELARRLATHPAVCRVFYPGLDDHPGHKVAACQMTGYGGLVSFTPLGGSEAAAAAMGRFPSLRRSASFGACATLVVRPEAMWTGLGRSDGAAPLPSGLIRIGAGLEDVEDLWSWIDEGLR